MALLLAAAALALVSSKPLVERAPPTARLVLAGLLAGCAFGFKQSFVAAPVAIFLFLLIGRRALRAASLFAASYAATLLAVIAFSWGAWGSAFFDNVFAAMGSNPIHLQSSALTYSRELLGEAPGLLVAGAIAFVLTLAAKGERGVVPWFYVVALVWNFLSSGKAGAGTNYFAELGLASVAILPVALAAARRTRPLAWGLVALPLVANGVVSLAHGARLTQPLIPSLDLRPYLARYRTPERKLITKEKIAIQLGASEGYDWYLLDLLVASGKARLDPWLGKIAQHEYDLIVLDQTTRSRAEIEFFDAAKRAGYRVTFANPVVVELRPGPAGTEGPSAMPAVSPAPEPGRE
jgi:hypothetical protein